MPITTGTGGRKKGDFLTSFLVFLLISVFICGFALSIVSFFYYLNQRKQNEKNLAAMSQKIDALSNRVSKLEELLKSGTSIEKIITSANYLSNLSVDLEQIIEELVDDPTTGYIRLFVIGQENVWVTFRKGNEIYFSRELKPGLAPYKFYYFKGPSIQTQYSIKIPRDCTIVIGKPGTVYFLVYGVGTSKHPTKVVIWKETRVENLERDFSLYIPK
ncbi:MAG: Uncharacterized protein XD58_1263 [Thermotoga sp. 50_1627]|uniref:hypothetical protein n=1 Tax=Pseudothermotoga sp. TaxID=2033661 RepID=UPI00076D460E|nr:MAG: Uncharacterized protein XD45_0788 [Thermotoga sp. 50_64]KUK24763.1 MAG: Uncharacterized protein XD58_1263 [Thermotoga sp. 50_1627]MBC7116474.1 hypothetical protein [Pseudothermotoga sp.]MDK2923083.1 hypothetical protein [Pseudothermotoga sp.]HBT40333.1 hypothetical protein [Pseudothermotoga sp.]